ncbi:hypothetical protein AUJ14_03320 [Candidatus Micrarchaeota archaeon CG1_02_55_22]|nr:MAG: hypothetical protein AUJ14_03320 [Candidatus Micrarchaeota archaeon CG1_02_55_22]
MTEKLYLSDAYLKECVARVTNQTPDGVILDKTIFYASGGGQPGDTGLLKTDDKQYLVTGCIKRDDETIHLIEGEKPAAGREVTVEIDWDKRYALMRMHTATHVLSALMHKQGCYISGNQLGVERTRIDFTMESFDRKAYEKTVKDANEALARGLEVSIGEMPREEALATEGMIKLAGALPPDIVVLRTVRIGDVDYQADGGTHVHNTKECGQITIEKLENKGAKNKRLYFTLTT